MASLEPVAGNAGVKESMIRIKDFERVMRGSLAALNGDKSRAWLAVRAN